MAVPAGFATTIPAPEGVPRGTVARMLVELTTVNEAAGAPPKLTYVVPLRFVPVIVTSVPSGPEVGVNEVIVGGRKTETVAEEMTLPPAVVNVTLPDVAPVGTLIRIMPADTTLHAVTLVALTFTEVAAPTFDPSIVTSKPTPTEVGATYEIVGATEAPPTVRDPEETTEPPTVVTVILPLVATLGIEVTIVVAST